MALILSHSLLCSKLFILAFLYLTNSSGRVDCHLKTVLVIGSRESQKSLVANCLVTNKNNDTHPFRPRNELVDSYCGAFLQTNKSMYIVDTMALDDQTLNQEHAFDLVRQALAIVHNRVDIVLLVTRRGEEIDATLVSLFRLFTDHVLGGVQLASANMIFLCNGCDKGWLKRNRNEHIDQLLAMCNGKKFEFDLNSLATTATKSTFINADREITSSNGVRKMTRADWSIADLVSGIDQFVTSCASSPLHLDHVQNETFKYAYLSALRHHFMCTNEASLERMLNKKKRIILIGTTGSGKSTLANCLFNQHGSLNLTQHYPFATSDNSHGCTTRASMLINENMVLIDTIGMGDTRFDQESVIAAFRSGLAKLNNTVDLVVFTLKKDRFTRQLFNFYNHMQHEFFQRRVLNNSLIVCSGCPGGWLSSNRQENPYLNELLNTCGNRTHEFNLPFDLPSIQLSSALRRRLEKTFEAARTKSIRQLVTFVESIAASKVNLEYIQDKTHKRLFQENVDIELMPNTHSCISTSKKIKLSFSAITLGVNMIISASPVLTALSGGYLLYEYVTNASRKIADHKFKTNAPSQCLLNVRVKSKVFTVQTLVEVNNLNAINESSFELSKTFGLLNFLNHPILSSL